MRKINYYCGLEVNKDLFRDYIKRSMFAQANNLTVEDDGYRTIPEYLDAVGIECFYFAPHHIFNNDNRTGNIIGLTSKEDYNLIRIMNGEKSPYNVFELPEHVIEIFKSGELYDQFFVIKSKPE